eukprot:6590431-Pyramimonas_sp.AAC.1
MGYPGCNIPIWRRRGCCACPERSCPHSAHLLRSFSLSLYLSLSSSPSLMRVSRNNLMWFKSRKAESWRRGTRRSGTGARRRGSLLGPGSRN